MPATCSRPPVTAFLQDFCHALQPFIRAGLVNSLTQTVVKLTAPGVPDIYQGCEALDFSLVDPDNRREPDFRRSWPRMLGCPRRAGRRQPAGPLAERGQAEAAGDGRAPAGSCASSNLRSCSASATICRSVQPGVGMPDKVLAFARTHGDQAVIVIASLPGL